MSRREKIEALLADNPDDPFLRYGLALELEKESRHEESIGHLRALMRLDTPYVPAFFMSAQQFAKLSRIDEARTSLRDGIEQARAQGNSHAAGEMAEFLASLGRLGE